jgi:hypothetical protein
MITATNNINAIAGILILATLVESFVEYLIRPLVKPWVEGKELEEGVVDWRGLLLRYIAAIVGMVACFIYEADLLALLGLVSPWPWVGFVVTGLVIGRGANFVHDFTGRWIQPAN